MLTLRHFTISWNMKHEHGAFHGTNQTNGGAFDRLSSNRLVTWVTWTFMKEAKKEQTASKICGTISEKYCSMWNCKDFEDSTIYRT